MFKTVKMGPKIMLALCTVAVIAVVIGLIGYRGMGTTMERYDLTAWNTLPGTQAAFTIQELQMDILGAERTLLIPDIDKSVADSQLETINDAWREIDSAWKTYESISLTAKGQEMWQKFVPAWEVWKNDHQEFMKLYQQYAESGDKKIYAALKSHAFGKEAESLEESETLLGEIISLNAKQAEADMEQADRADLSSRRLLIGAIVAGLAVSLLLGIFFSKNIAGIISGLLNETKRVSQSVVLGHLGARGDAQKVNFEFREIIKGMNDILESMVGHFDAVPTPLMVIDREFNIQYMNRVGLDLLGLSRQQVIGTKCYNHFKTSDCNTANCACAQAMQSGQKASRETDAHPRGMDLDIAYSGVPIKNTEGQTVGVLEIVVDQTAIKKAARVMEKLAAYQEHEVEKLVVSLGKLAKGDLQIQTSVAATDEDTKAIGQNFSKINSSLEDTVKAINLMAADVNTLAEAAIGGQLDKRADASKHGGEYGRIVEGINKTLDAVIAPVNEAAACLKEMSRGNLDVAVTGDYKGDHAVMKNALNTTVEALNEILGQVAIAVDQVAGGSQQIASSSQALSQGASESASTLEETASSMQEITAQTKQNAENAAQANQLATQTRASAEKGNEQMSEMV
ncbi:MAG: MCP four helix bundle domain-containing protein, partial [Bacillota bacterium]